MVDETRQIVTEYKVKLDKSSYDRLTRQLQQVQKKQATDAKKTLSVQDDIRKAFSDQIKQQEKAYKETKKQIKAEKTRLELLEKQNSQVRNQVGSLGDVDTSFQTIGSVAGAPGLQAAGDVFAVAEAFGQLKGAAPVVAEQVKTFAGSLGAKGLGLGAVIGVATLAVIGFGAVVLRDLVKGMDAAKAAIEARAQAEADLNVQLSGGATTGQLEEELKRVNAELEAAVKNVALAEEDLVTLNNLNAFEKIVAFGGNIRGSTEELKRQREDEQRRLEQRIEVINSLLSEGETAANDAADAQLKNVDALRQRFDIEQRVNSFIQSATQESLDGRLEALNAEIALIEIQKKELSSLLELETEQGKQARDNTEALSKRLEDLRFELDLLATTGQQAVDTSQAETEAKKAQDKQEKALAETQKERERVLGRLTNLEQQATTTLENFTRAQAKTLEDRQIRDLRELQDWQAERAQQQQEHQRELADIQADGNDRIRDLQGDIGDLSSDFYTEEQDAVRNYQKDLRKLNQQYYIEDKQALDDHLSDLRNAEQGNDVLAFIQAQQNFEKEKRERETNRSQDFKALNDQYAEERRLRKRNFEARKQELQREIQAVRQNTQQRIAEAQQAFRREQQLAADERQRRLQRQREDDQIADARERDALRRALQAIQAKTNAEVQGANAVIRASSGIVAIANRIASAVRNAGGSSGSSSGSSSRFSGSTALGEKSYERAQRERRAARAAEARRVGDIQELNRLGAAYADGGIVTRPTISLLGEKRPEIVFPLRKGNLRKDLEDFGFNTRSRSSGGVNVSIAFNPNMNIGEITSPSEVSNALQQFATDLQRQIEVGINKSVNLTA